MSKKEGVIFWTEEEIKLLIFYWNIQGKSSGEIGKILGKTPKAIIAKIARLRRLGTVLLRQSRWGVIKVQPSDESKEYRKCLKCRETFLSNHQFNKICRRCSSINAGVYESSIMRVLK